MRLLQYGANVDDASVLGVTPLLFASLYDVYPVAKLLIKYGADVNKQNNSGAVPLHFAVVHKLTAISHLQYAMAG